MTESTVSILISLMTAATALLGLCFGALVVIARRLNRLGGEVRRADHEVPLQKVESATLESRSGAFARFMTQRPELAEVSKSEQFAAFRKWRKEQGLNWEGR